MAENEEQKTDDKQAEEAKPEEAKPEEASQEPATESSGEQQTEPAVQEGRPSEEEDEVSEEEEAKMKLPFPTAAVVRIMKANMDSEKMLKKDVKVEMNKWLGGMCAQVSKEMNKFPYVMMHLNELKEAKRVYEDLENFQKVIGKERFDELLREARSRPDLVIREALSKGIRQSDPV